MELNIECAICGRETPPAFAEKHHLVPKSKGGKATIDVCCHCGDQVHKLFSMKELEKEYNTLPALLENPAVQRWVAWVKDKKSFTFSMKTKKQR